MADEGSRIAVGRRADPERGKPRESSDRSRHPLGIPEPRSGSSPEGPDPRRDPKQRFRYSRPAAFRLRESSTNPEGPISDIPSFEENPSFPSGALVSKRASRFRENDLSRRRNRTSAGRPNDPKVSRDGQPFDRLPLPFGSRAEALSHPKPLSFPNGPFRDDAVSELPPNRQTRTYPPLPPNASPDPNKISRPKNKIRAPRKIAIRNSQYAPFLRVVRRSSHAYRT